MISVAADPAHVQSDQSRKAVGRTRLLVVDDHPAVRAGLRGLLADQADFEVVANVATADAALTVAEREQIDVAIVDYQLAPRNGLWLSRKLKRLPEPPAVLIYSAYTDGILASAAAVAEADGIVSKGALGSELCDAIRSLARGQRRLPPVPRWLAPTLRRQLDYEEQAILGMLLAGIGPLEISETLRISSGDLETRLWTMLRQLEAMQVAPKIDSEGAGRGRARADTATG